MKKFLDILIFTLLFFLIFSYFSGRNIENTQTGLQFTALKNSYKVPAWVQLQIQNFESSSIVFDPCIATSMRHSGEKISIPSEFCWEVQLWKTDIHTIDFSSHYQLFEAPGNYIFEFELNDKKFIEQVEVEYRGTIGKLFIAVFYAPVYNLLAFLIHNFSNSLGWAIVGVTILIRILLLYPQHKMMVSQRKMQAVQPKIKKLQEKYKGEQQKLGLELMQLYKKEGVNPLGSCGFLLIQMPILLVIYNIIMNITSERNEFYLYPFLSDFHISQIQYNFLWIDLLSSGGITGIGLALVVGLIQYIQVKLSLMNNAHKDQQKGVVLEKKKGSDDYNSFMPDPEMMNKFMLYGMPVMVAVFTYTLIAGVWIYWWISTLFAIFQQIFVNKIIKK